MNAPAATEHPSVLIVEDERIVAMDLQLLLSQIGYRVVANIADGAAAIAAVRTLRIDLILMDVRLQGTLDGIETAAAIRAFSDIPIVFLTAHADPTTRERIRTLAPYGYLVKPFDAQLLEVVLETSLARYAAERRTLASERWLNTLLASLADAVIATDIDGRVIMLNPVAEELLGLPAASVLGQPINAIMQLRHPDTNAPLPHPLVAALAGANRQLFQPEMLLCRADGSTCRIDDSIALIQTELETLGAVMVFHDSTPRRIAEHARVAEQQRAEEARQRERLKVLAGGIAHDLNNMLTSVLGNIDLALEELPPEHPVSPLLQHAYTGGQRAAELTHQLLVYAGQARSQWAPLDLSLLVGETVRLLRSNALKDRTINLDLTSLPLTVNADAAQLRQVVLNLLVNAAEALAPTNGAVTVRLEPAPPATVPSHLPAGAYALLSVIDTGVGIQQAALAHIFDPFFSTKFTGRGLGLALVQGVIQEHGGAVGVQSAVGEGTTFSIWLPVQPAAAEVRQMQPVAPAWQAAGTVLVIDDEASLRTITGRMLQRLGFSVLPAASGEEGLQIFQTHTDTITCTIVDATMPGMSGIEVVRAVRQLHPTLPVVIMSGYTADPTIMNVVDELHLAFLPKPFNLNELSSRIQQVLS